MQNIVIFLALLVAPYWGLLPFGMNESLRGRAGLALVFVFTGIGHFLKTNEMSHMLPPWIPGRVPLILGSGVLELLLAIGLVVPATSRLAGIAVCLFLVLVFPSNVYATMARVPFGGHEFGPAYLAVRLPLQLLLIGWSYWFAVRGQL